MPPLALSVDRAAAALGLSPSSFRRYVLPHIRSVKVGQVRIVPVAGDEDQRPESAPSGVAHHNAGEGAIS